MCGGSVVFLFAGPSACMFIPPIFLIAFLGVSQQGKLKTPYFFTYALFGELAQMYVVFPCLFSAAP
jgi:hypothetical protein